ncbi:MAG: phosphonate ABC transporter, permease protein PhnE [Thermoplasmatota archaeon]
MNTSTKRVLGWGAALLAVLWAIVGLDLHEIRLDALGRSASWFVQEAFPPDWSILPVAWDGFVETVQIALLATLLGFALSLPLALASTTLLVPTWIAAPARVAASAVRVLPSLLWAIIMVLLLGFGPLAGVAAMTAYTIGYLAKLQYEALEGLPRDALEAARAAGLTRLQIGRHILLPSAGNALRSQALFMFEYNIRSSTIIGVVGAGGIGQLLALYLKFFQYDRVAAILLLMLAAVVVLDAASLLLRRRFVEHLDQAPRARWREVLAGRRSEP